MSFTRYADLIKSVDQEVTVIGWIAKTRFQARTSFLTLRLGYDQLLQVVLTADVLKAAEEQHGGGKKLTTESYVTIRGKITTLPPKATSFLPVELQATKLEVLSLADAEYPNICPPDAGPDTKLEKRHVFMRDPRFMLITRLRADLLKALRLHFEETECMEIVPPSFTGVECEGGATLFHVKHPGRSSDKPMDAFLTQSSQFALEMAVPAHGDVYCIAPSFRAEHSHTRRHLTEFVHAEAEWAGMLTFDQHLDKLRSLLEGTLRHFLKVAEPTLKKFGGLERVQKLYDMTKDILVLDHKDAIAKCHEFGIFKDDKQTPFSETDDIPEMQERALIDRLDRIVFLVRFPKAWKSFYMAICPDDPTRVLGCDVEVPGVGEIVGSGVREHDRARLEQRLLESGLKPEDYAEYLDLRSFGFGMTSGMGLGVDRLLCWLTNSSSIKEVCTYPRFPGYLRP